MTKRILACVLSAAMALGLAACGKAPAPAPAPSAAPADTSASAPAPAASGEKVKLRLVTISTDANQTAIMDDYIKKNIGTALPNIEVEFEPGGGGEDISNKLKTYNSTGDLPDVWYSTADYAFPIIAANNQLDLTDAINKDGFITKYGVPEALKHRDGKTFSISSGADTYFTPRIFYNTKIFEENKVAVPTTYEELKAACETFKAAGITPVSLMGKGGWAPQLYLVQTMIQLHDPAVAEQLLKNETDFNNPVCLEAVNKIEELAKMGAFPEGAANLDYGPALEMFTSGRSAMFWGFSWEVPNLAADTNISLMQWPRMSEKVDPATLTQIWGSPLNGYAVNAKSEHQAEAIQLAEFCVQMEAQFYANAGSSTNLDPGIPLQGQSDLMKKNLELYNTADKKINAIFLNAMDGKTGAEYGLLGANLLTGSYTGKQFVEDFGKVWAENEYFK